MHTRSSGLCEEFRIRYRVLPPDLKEFVQTAHVEVIELPGMSAIRCLGFTSIQELGEHHGTVNLQLGSKADSPAPLDVFAKSSEDKKKNLHLRLTHALVSYILLEEPDWQQLMYLFVFVLFVALKKRIPPKIGILSCFV